MTASTRGDLDAGGLALLAAGIAKLNRVGIEKFGYRQATRPRFLYLGYSQNILTGADLYSLAIGTKYAAD